MACPFAQLSPILLLSFFALFFQFGASFFSPKPIMASLNRGRSILGQTSSRSRGSSPPPHHQDAKTGGRGNGNSHSGPRMLGVGCVLAPPEHETAAEEHEDLVGDPLPWTESMGSGGPLLYAGLLRWQVSAMQIGLGLDRVPCPCGLSTVCNSEKKARVKNLVYSGDRVRKLRMSYLDTPGMQVFSSVSYGGGGHDFPLLSMSAMSMGRVRVLALDLQPLFSGQEYADKYADAYASLRAIRENYPELGQELQKDYYKGSHFFSENMLYARWGPEEEAAGFMEKVVMPAFQECTRAYVDLVNRAPPPAHARGSFEEEVILERQAEFDRFHAEREQVRPTMKAHFGASWADSYISEHLFAYGSGRR